MKNDEKFLLSTVQELVDFPNDVEVTRKMDELGVLLTLKVNPADMGKVIGREGNTAKALRILIRIVGMKDKERVNLKIVDPRVKEVDNAYNEAKDVGSAPLRKEY